eukprot:Skav219397  [mRNA]  locus=scaffold2133:352891:353130:+ [translate_table: standard]
MALAMAPGGLSCKPSVRAHDAKRDLALCVASDGLWDFVEEKVPLPWCRCRGAAGAGGYCWLILVVTGVVTVVDSVIWVW